MASLFITEFQFLMVRLKGKIFDETLDVNNVSIPYGTIKRICLKLNI